MIIVQFKKLFTFMLKNLYPSLFLILISCSIKPSHKNITNPKIASIYNANKIANIIHAKHQHTFYCNCFYQGKSIDLNSCGYKVQKNLKRAKRLEWEHIVPVSRLAKDLACWNTAICCNTRFCYKRRACCEKIDLDFIKMATDLHNIVPEIGELNAIRSNYNFAELPHINFEQFGGCKFKVDRKNRKVEAYRNVKGIVARTYLYMNDFYNLNLSPDEIKLFAKWNDKYPPSVWETNWNKQVYDIQGTNNKYISKYSKLY